MARLTMAELEMAQHDGLTYKEAADKFGSNITSVYNWCKRRGIELARSARGGSNVKNMVGQFNSLEILGRAASKGNLAWWECRCLCGNIFEACGSDIRQGKIKTCGCRISIKNRRNWQGCGDIPKSYWSSLVNGATQRSIEFDLTIEDANAVWLKQGSTCAVSGLPISFQDRTASLDRIDNQKGYGVKNVQWVHKDVNKLKGTFSLERLISLCKAISIHSERPDDSCRSSEEKID